MQLSAEIRWFWKHNAPTGLEDWFQSDIVHASPAGDREERIDFYLQDPKNAELGVKMRGENKGVEVKALVARGHALNVSPFAGRIEVWTKVSSVILTIPEPQRFRTQKVRWLRKFDTTEQTLREVEADQMPQRGCNVELTKVTLDNGEIWLTFGLEAFGGIESIQGDIALVAEEMARRNAPALSGGVAVSYPEWLGRLNGTGSTS